MAGPADGAGQKNWLSTLPEDVEFAELVSLAKIRWRVERGFQKLKDEVGLKHYEGRRWKGLHRHSTSDDCLLDPVSVVRCSVTRRGRGPFLQPPATPPPTSLLQKTAYAVYVTLGASPWMDDRHVILGRVVDGMDLLQDIARLETDEGDRPNTGVVVLRVAVQDAS